MIGDKLYWLVLGTHSNMPLKGEEIRALIFIFIASCAFVWSACQPQVLSLEGLAQRGGEGGGGRVLVLVQGLVSAI